MSLCHPLAFRKPPSFHFGLLSTALSLTVSTIFSILPEKEGNHHCCLSSCKVSLELWSCESIVLLSGVQCPLKAVVFGTQFPLVWADIHSFDTLQFSSKGIQWASLTTFHAQDSWKELELAMRVIEIKLRWCSKVKKGQISQGDQTDPNASFATS